MTTANKLQRILDTKTDIKNAIEGQGRDLTNKTFETDYAAEIALIDGGGGNGGTLEITGQEVIGVEFAENITALDTVQVGPFGSTTNGDVWHRLPNPATLPTSDGFGTAFSNDGTYFVVGHDVSPRITIYKRSGDTFTKLTDPATLPTGDGEAAAFSSDNTYLAIAHASSPFLTIYKRDGDTFTKLANPAILPPGQGNGTAFSTDGTYLAVSHFTSPFITIYKRSGDTFTKLTNPATLPTGQGMSTDFSPDGTYLAVGHGTAPFITIYERDEDTFTKLTNPSNLPSNTVNDVSFSPDGTYLATVHNFGNFVAIYKRDGNDFQRIFRPSNTQRPAMNTNGVSFSPDGIYVACAHSTLGAGTSNFITIYKRNGDNFTKLPDLALPLVGTGRKVTFSLDGTYLAFAHAITPFLAIYKIDTNLAAIKTNNKNKTIFDPRENQNIITYGYAKESGTTGQTKEVVALFKPEV